MLIGAEDPGDLEGAISAASLAELHVGVLVATANTHNVSLLTHNSGDFQIIDDLVTVQAP